MLRKHSIVIAECGRICYQIHSFDIVQCCVDPRIGGRSETAYKGGAPGAWDFRFEVRSTHFKLAIDTPKWSRSCPRAASRALSASRCRAKQGYADRPRLGRATRPRVRGAPELRRNLRCTKSSRSSIKESRARFDRPAQSAPSERSRNPVLCRWTDERSIGECMADREGNPVREE